MIWHFRVAIVLTMAPYALSQSRPELLPIEEQNLVIEIFNNCKCVPLVQCDPKTNTIRTSGEKISEQRSTIPHKIKCLSGIFSEKTVCCKESPKKCGTGDREIQFNELPTDGEFPWTASLFLNDKYVFGGSLIHPKVVLTACHSVYKKEASSFRVAVSGRVRRNEYFSEERKRVSEIIYHPSYDNDTVVYDAALVILEEPFLSRDGTPVTTLCLPPKNATLEGARCLVTGWGQDENEKYTQTMKKFELPFVNHQRCQTLLRNTPLGYYFILNRSFMCAGGEEGKDACTGDGGGPLMCPMSRGSNQYFQAGIVSWGIQCGVKDYPGVYTDVQYIADWIKDELKRRNLEI